MRNLQTFLVLLILTAFVWFPSMVSGQENTRRPYRFLIPSGYVGWVKIEFNIKDAPPLSDEGGYYVFKIPDSGRFQTSSNDEFGLARDEYFYVSGECRERLVSGILLEGITMIWPGYSGGSVMTNSKEKPYKYIPNV